jgi:hypothetical protein
MKKLAWLAALILSALVSFWAGRRSVADPVPCGCALDWQTHQILSGGPSDVQYDFYICRQTGRRFATLSNFTGGNRRNPWDVKLDESNHPSLEFQTEEEAKKYAEFTVPRRAYSQHNCEFGTFPGAQAP